MLCDLSKECLVSTNGSSAYCSDSLKMLVCVCVGFSKSIVFLENRAFVN